MRKIISLLSVVILILLRTTELQANSAQPGIWDAGGTGTYSLLFPEEHTGEVDKIEKMEEPANSEGIGIMEMITHPIVIIFAVVIALSIAIMLIQMYAAKFAEKRKQKF